MQCTKCGEGRMEDMDIRKWAPRIGYVLIYFFLIVIFFSLYGVFSSKNGSDNIMPIAVGLTPLIVAPFIIELRRKKCMHGFKCTKCGYFIKKEELYDK